MSNGDKKKSLWNYPSVSLAPQSEQNPYIMDGLSYRWLPKIPSRLNNSLLARHWNYLLSDHWGWLCLILMACSFADNLQFEALRGVNSAILAGFLSCDKENLCLLWEILHRCMNTFGDCCSVHLSSWLCFVKWFWVCVSKSDFCTVC